MLKFMFQLLIQPFLNWPKFGIIVSQKFILDQFFIYNTWCINIQQFRLALYITQIEILASFFISNWYYVTYV